MSPTIDPITRVISWVPLSVFGWSFAVLVVAFLDRENGVELFVAAAIATVMHFIVSEGVFKMGGSKIGFMRRRPYVAYPHDIKPIGSKFSDSSFPSSHVSSTVAILTTLSFFYPGFALFAVLLTVIIGFSRLHNGMHYPSDILAGVILGVIYALIALFITKIII